MRADRQSNTAQYVAAVRAVLTHKGIVDDPYAAPMLTPSMKLAVAVLRRTPRLTNSAFFAGLANRTVVFDEGVVAAIRGGITQVVTIAAGYDARPWRFASPSVEFFEVDHPATQAEKRRRAPTPPPIYVACDLRTDPLGDALRTAGFDQTRPCVFVIEGLTMYLSVADVSKLLEQTLEVAAPGSRLIVNFAMPAGTGGRSEPLHRVLALLGRLRDEPFGEARNLTDPAALVAKSGWTCTAATGRIISASI